MIVDVIRCDSLVSILLRDLLKNYQIFELTKNYKKKRCSPSQTPAIQFAENLSLGVQSPV